MRIQPFSQLFAFRTGDNSLTGFVLSSSEI